MFSARQAPGMIAATTGWNSGNCKCRRLQAHAVRRADPLHAADLLLHASGGAAEYP